MTIPIAPHGGELINRLASTAEAEEIHARAGGLPRLTLSARESADLDLIAVGAMSPLTGFMSRADYEGAVREMRLADGTLWSLPITLSAPPEAAAAFEYESYGGLVTAKTEDRAEGRHAFLEKRPPRWTGR